MAHKFSPVHSDPNTHSTNLEEPEMKGLHAITVEAQINPMKTAKRSTHRGSRRSKNLLMERIGGESEEEMSDTEYYEENEELTRSQMKPERLQEVLIQVAWELWQEATWSGQIDYNLGPPCENEL
ncbi:14123_t:CDS:2 [Gigaspora rosea]|nr:14123_t:CDS:2 [Gigaspora rosea]